MKTTKYQRDAAKRTITPSFNILRVAAAVIEGETVTIGSNVFEVDTDGSVTSGNETIDLSAAATPAYAVATLTLAGNAVANETVTIAGKVYTWKASPTTTANEVKVGATASDSLDNLIAAVNGGTGSGTLYGSATVAHTTISAAAGSGDTAVFTALTKGTGGNAYASTETMTNGSFGGATFASGADATATEFVDALVIAINAAGIGWRATELASNYVFVQEADAKGVDTTTAFTETLSGSNNAWAATTAEVGNGAPSANEAVVMISRVPTAAEVTAQNMAFPFSFNPTVADVTVKTSAGVYRTWDGAITISGNLVLVTSSGSTDVASGDIVTVTAA